LLLIKSEVTGEAERAGRADRAEGTDGAREQTALVRRALEQLSERDREALLLWDAGFSYPEIAAQTGLAVGAVGTTLARARKKLVDALPQTAQDRQQGHG
jgi:RNA polymerase sigma factor (sigma-70 family)